MRISDFKRVFTQMLVGYSVLANGRRLYLSTTAITADSTTTSAPSGSIAVTSHATGLGSLFISDGTKWQNLSGKDAQHLGIGTIATGATTDAYATVPFTGKVVAAIFTGIDALAQHASNYQTFSITNLGQAGGGSTAMLAASDANTTKTTTGSAVSANTPRALTLHGTAANLLVTAYDRLRFRTTPSGTPANTITGATLLLVFERAL